MDSQTIVIRGAREHNLQNINLDLPKNQLIVFTGVSGSGKSSLAFDTLYAEGQRRYVESLSNYARQFLGQLPKPDVEYITGLSPAIAIQQKTAGRNPRSTVGTITEISDYLRVLYARVGQGHCTNCDRPITAQTREQIIARILSIETGTRYMLLAPVVRSQKGEFKDFFADMVKRGYIRARVDGEIVKLTDDLKLDKRIKHEIAIVIDRLKADEPASLRPRVAEAVEQALALAEGAVVIAFDSAPDQPADAQNQPDLLLSARYACTKCSISYEPPSPQLFSFNSPLGMCLTCDGIGMQYTFDETLLVPDATLSLHDGAIAIIGSLKSMGRWRKHIYEGVGKSLGIDIRTPWNKLDPKHRYQLLHGAGDAHIVWEWKQRGGKIWKHSGRWDGIVPQLMTQFKKTSGGPRRAQLEKYMSTVRCPACQGERLNPQARAVRLGEKTLIALGATPVGKLAPWLETLQKTLTSFNLIVAGELLKEIQARLGFLLNVGLHYLTLDRTAPTLSGGESQRIRLAGQIGSGLVGVLYILDEPSIGLHARDNAKLLASLEKLRDMGNTVLVVEHDEDTIRAADYLVDFGPGPGLRGGQIVAAGPPEEVFANPKSVTGKYMMGQSPIQTPTIRRNGNGHNLRIVGARHHNLKNITVEIPLGKFVVVTGVSGSGKSSLINGILKDAMLASTNPRRDNGADTDDNPDTRRHTIGDHDRIEGSEYIDKIIDIDQSAIGRTPRSNPATYIKVWDEIRTLYSEMTDAKVRGYQPGRFSFNVSGGRCEACQGNGSNRLEMDFLADVWVKCAVCEGQRFTRETLQVKYRGKSIHDILEMEVGQALELFEHHPKISTMLRTLHDVGLDYIKLGQPSPTLSGGEAQRIKLAKELCRRGTGKTLYILDEPTTGLHFDDIRKLLEVLHNFVEQGNTVLIIEHNLDVIKTADWLIDIGPEGGSGGGELVCVGTPENIVQCENSFTGQALKPVLSTKQLQHKSKKLKKKPHNKRKADTITTLCVQGASQHNLKHINVALPRNQMTVFSGPSGSGKSSLAMDTIYAEGQRRYVESLSSYARQFLGQIQKPRFEHITGLSPAVAIEQKTTTRSPRSTVGTVTEIYDYLRILYARIGVRHCPKDGSPMGTQTSDQIIEKILAHPDGTKLYILAPIERKGQEKYDTLFEEIRRTGYNRVRIDGKSHNLDELPAIDHRRKHRIEVVIDRNIVRPNTRTRIAEAVEQALDLGRGIISLAYVDSDRSEPDWSVERYSQHLACATCGTSYETLNPHHYSFNSPLGWCATCEGLGVQRGSNAQLLISDEKRTIREGVIAAWPMLNANSAFLPFAEALTKHIGCNLDTSWNKLSPEQQRAILHGTGENLIRLELNVDSNSANDGKKGRRRLVKSLNSKSTISTFQYKGLFPTIDKSCRISSVYRMKMEHLVDEVACTACDGSRLRLDSASTQFMGLTIAGLTRLPLDRMFEFINNVSITGRENEIVSDVLHEIKERAKFLISVGLNYLSLDRRTPTLSGGEGQRIRLASQIGSGLTGVLYILDEPTVGLHPRDNARLLTALQSLRDLGNTLLLVEHDRDVIQAADYLVDFGPGAGDFGGRITAEGQPSKVSKSMNSSTGAYLSGRASIPIPLNRRCKVLAEDNEQISFDEKSIASYSPHNACISILGARHHNLRDITVHIPLGLLVAVTGVSGSGKSSLINEVLYNTVARKLHRAQTPGTAHDSINGIENIDKIIAVDQSPIGNAPSSNPATYTGVFDQIRELFTRLPASKLRGYTTRRFSFNQKGGRCEACEGNGHKRVEMHFLPDVWVQCDVCNGRRYNQETLLVKYQDRSISDVLDLSVSAALELFINIPKIRIILETLNDVGLGYMSLGQSAPTMSGGEAQRVKLAAELARPSTGKTLYLLDEPTTGLHFEDVKKLLDVLNRLTDMGNSVVLVEHNLDIIKSSDWIIDIGPEAGINGGLVVAQGTPELVAEQSSDSTITTISHTSRLLASVLSQDTYAYRPIYNQDDARRARINDVQLSEVGKAEKLPWEIDGIKWHTEDRVTTRGSVVKWDGKALKHVVNALESTGKFAPTNWRTRSMVEVAAEVKFNGWFLHALTGHEGYLTLNFRVARKSFQEKSLISLLGLKPLSEMQGFENYHRQNRVEVSNIRGAWQQITITITSLAEVTTTGFNMFIQQAISAFETATVRINQSLHDVMPWKVNGERWHTSTKGFPPGHPPMWEVSLVADLVKLVRGVEPRLEVKWDCRDAISLKIPGMSQSCVRIKTKDPTALKVKLASKAGQFNLERLNDIGHDPSIMRDRSHGLDIITLQFTKVEQSKVLILKALLSEQLMGIIENYEQFETASQT